MICNSNNLMILLMFILHCIQFCFLINALYSFDEFHFIIQQNSVYSFNETNFMYSVNSIQFIDVFNQRDGNPTGLYRCQVVGFVQGLGWVAFTCFENGGNNVRNNLGRRVPISDPPGTRLPTLLPSLGTLYRGSTSAKLLHEFCNEANVNKNNRCTGVWLSDLYGIRFDLGTVCITLPQNIQTILSRPILSQYQASQYQANIRPANIRAILSQQ